MRENNRKTGDKGESIACFYLEKHGYLIQERNYLKKWGEIDIIAVKDGILHFIEVKSVIDKGKIGGYRPEENVHELKQRKLRRIIQTYLNHHRYGLDADFQFHVITVVMDQVSRKAQVRFLKNMIL